MVDITLSTDDILKWARHFEQIPQQVPVAVSNAMNYIGENLVREVADYISSTTDIDPQALIRQINVKQATPDDMTWTMDASDIAPPSLNWSNPWMRPPADNTFDGDTLVNVVTMGDEVVCEKCQDAAEAGPYQMADAMQLNPYGNGLIHPNCRCMIAPFYSYRKLPVTFSRPDAGGPQLLSLRQLSRAVKDQLKISLSTVQPQKGLWFWN